MRKTRLLLASITAMLSLSFLGCNKDQSINFDVNTIEGLIGFTARKYVKNFNETDFANKCKLDDKTSCTHDELLGAIRLAFEGKLPEHTGERTYLGYFGDVSLVRDLSEEEKKNFDFLNNIGLIGKEYDPEEEMDIDDTQLYMERMYKYYGTNYKDDFARSVNYDYFYNSDEDTEWTYDKEAYSSLILDSKRIQDNVEDLYFEMKEDNFEPSVANIDKYVYGDATYDILEDEYYISQLEAIQACESLNELIDLEVQLQQLNAINSFGFQFNGITTLSENADFCLGKVDCKLMLGQNIYISNQEQYEARLNNTVEKYTKLLTNFSPLTNEEVDDYIDNYKDIVAILRSDAINLYPEYMDQMGYTYFDFLIVNVDSQFYDGCFEDLFGDLANCSFATMPLTEMILNFLYIYEILAGGVTFEQYQKFCYLSYVVQIESLLNEIKEGKASRRLLQFLTEYTIMSYYQDSPKYKKSVEYCSNMVDDLKKEYENTIRNNKNISIGGKVALIEKIRNIDADIMFDSKKFEYKIADHFNYEYTGSLFKDYTQHKRFVADHVEELSSDGVYRPEYSIFTFDVFVSNAYYSPLENDIVMPTGAVMCVGYDYSSVSDEEIYGILGEVIAHELSHSIDPTCIYYDKDGKYVEESIIPESDLDLYSEAQEKFAEYYSVEVSPGVNQVGAFVLNEAVADNFGFQVLTNLLEKNQGFNFKKFFEYFVRNFVTKGTRADYEHSIYTEEEHPDGPERANLILKNCLKFQQIYKFSKTDGMYRAEEDIIKVL